MELVAECQCGSLRAIVVAESFTSYLCHCRACQRRTGALLHAGAYFDKEQVRHQGPSKVYTRLGTSGSAVHFYFCPTCGTSVYWIREAHPNRIGIAVGCFADPAFPAPTLSVWEESKHPWLGLPAGIAHYELGINPDGTPMTRSQ